MTPPIEEIARGLTETMRLSMLRLPENGGYIQRYYISIRTADALTARGLWRGTDYGRSFTPLGQQVRTHLQSRQP